MKGVRIRVRHGKMRRLWKSITAPWREWDDLQDEVGHLRNQLLELRDDIKELRDELDAKGTQIDDVAEDVERNYASEQYVDDAVRELERSCVRVDEELERRVGNVEDDVRRVSK